ncbi:sigma-70 family RNA polymerase sigma factor [bacterium]|nr:sigma-70 family RNA polymerase sigma factor [bacterium]
MQSHVIEIQPEGSNAIDSATDEDLMQRYALGDTAAFDELFARHKGSVYSFIRGFITKEEMVDDLFQAVFIRLIKARKRYKPKAKFTTWLFTITRSVCIDEMRRTRNKKVISLYPVYDTEQHEQPVPEPRDTTPGPREMLHQTDLQQAIQEIILTLPDKQKEVLLLREKTDLTFADIAKMLRCTTNTIKSRMHYALLTLRQELKERGFDSL